jgi:hypothetical protein
MKLSLDYTSIVPPFVDLQHDDGEDHPNEGDEKPKAEYDPRVKNYLGRGFRARRLWLSRKLARVGLKSQTPRGSETTGQLGRQPLPYR